MSSNDCKMKEFFDAVDKGDMDKVRSCLLTKECPVDALDDTNMTPLQHACFKGNAKLCQLLLEFGANPNTREDKSGYSPLIFAALSGNAETVEALLEAGANPNYLNSVGRSASQMAGFVSYHHIVPIITNYIPRSFVDYYTTIHGLETEPHLPKPLANPLHHYLLHTNIHPINLTYLLESRKCSALMKNSEPAIKVLDLMIEQFFKNNKGPNDVMSMKCHHLRHVLLTSVKNSIESFRRSMLVPEHRDQFIRTIIGNYRYSDCQLFQHLLRTLTKTSTSPMECLTQAINGQWTFGSEPKSKICDCCGQIDAKQRCAGCKTIFYCDRKCQKLHWLVHKMDCTKKMVKT